MCLGVHVCVCVCGFTCVRVRVRVRARARVRVLVRLCVRGREHVKACRVQRIHSTHIASPPMIGRSEGLEVRLYVSGHFCQGVTLVWGVLV